jgi:hypothetical protein
MLAAVVLYVGVLAGCAAGECGSAEDERGSLGMACSSDGQCGDGLVCDRTDPLLGLCTRSCSDTRDCQREFGLGSFCIGANRCVRECFEDEQCLSGTACDTEFRWCR